MPELPLVGDEFAAYRLRSVLGRGGMSVVYMAENPRLGNVIALKVLAPELAGDDIFRTRFLEESRIAAAMNHPHVIPIHDMGSSDGLLYIAMRCVAGTDLRQMIHKRGRLQPETAIFLLGQAARALDAAHRQGLVHRDVKPGNLLVERGNDDADPDHLYLTDFGITKAAIGRSGPLSHGPRSTSGHFLGTVDYVAPEQIRGLTVLGRADQYSLGCVLYECLTGRAPFEKDLDAAIIWAHVEEDPAPPTFLRPDLPPEVDDVFARVLAKDPGDRFETCREFIATARDALGMTAAGTPAGGSPRPPRSADYWEVAHNPGAGVPGAPDMTAGIARPGRLRPESLLALAAPTSNEHGYPDQAPYEAPYQERAPAPAWTYRSDGSPLDHADRTDHFGAPGWTGDLEGTGGSGPSGPGPSGPGPGGFGPGGPGSGGLGPGGTDGSWGQPVSNRRGRERRDLRVPLLALAAAVLIAAAAGIGTAIGLSRGGAPALAAAPLVSRSAVASPASPASPTVAKAPVSALVTALEPVQDFTGRLSLASCKEPSTTFVTCTDPDPRGALASATFQTFPSMSALYTAYEAEVAAMAAKPFTSVQNTQDCGSPAPQTMGEISWNHSDQHTSKYSAAQIASGAVPYATAAGRMFCIQLPGGGENIIWTQNFGQLLVIAHGDVSHEQVWLWFVAVHHNVAFAGQPTMTGMPMAPSAPAKAPKAPATPKASAKPKVPAKKASATPMAPATPMPSGMKSSGMK
jgi:hypothetical protein